MYGANPAMDMSTTPAMGSLTDWRSSSIGAETCAVASRKITTRATLDRISAYELRPLAEPPANLIPTRSPRGRTATKRSQQEQGLLDEQADPDDDSSPDRESGEEDRGDRASAGARGRVWGPAPSGQLNPNADDCPKSVQGRYEVCRPMARPDAVPPQAAMLTQVSPVTTGAARQPTITRRAPSANSNETGAAP